MAPKLSRFPGVLLPARLRAYLARHELLGKVLANAGWLASDRLLRMAVGITVTALTARHLGPGNFGALNFATAFVALFAAVATLGLDGILLRDLVRNPERREQLVGSALAIRFSGAGLSAVAALLLIGWMRPSEPLAQLLVLILAAGQFPLALDVFDVLLQSQMRVRRVVLIRTTAFMAFAALRLALIAAAAPVQYFALAILGEQLTVAVLLADIARREGIRLPLSQASFGECRRQLSQCWPLVLSGLSVACYTRLDHVLLGLFLGDADVGIFAAGMRIIEALYLLPSVLASAAYPLLVAAHQQGSGVFEHKLNQLYLAMSAFGYVMAIAIFALGGPLISVLYGEKFAGAAAVVHITAASFVLISISAVYSKWVLICGLQRYHLFFSLLAAAFSVTINLILIPTQGVFGAALAALVSQAAPFSFLFLVPKLRRNGWAMLQALVLPVALWRQFRRP